MTNIDDFIKIGTSFAKFVSERAETDLDATEITIPAKLIKQITAKLEEFHNTMESQFRFTHITSICYNNLYESC